MSLLSESEDSGDDRLSEINLNYCPRDLKDLVKFSKKLTKILFPSDQKINWVLSNHMILKSLFRHSRTLFRHSQGSLFRHSQVSLFRHSQVSLFRQSQVSLFRHQVSLFRHSQVSLFRHYLRYHFSKILNLIV